MYMDTFSLRIPIVILDPRYVALLVSWYISFVYEYVW